MEYTLLKNIAEITMGQSPSSSSYNEEGVGIPFYQGNADFGELYPTARIWCNEPKKIANKNDILISVRAPIGALNYATEQCCIGRGLASITVKDEVLRNYVFRLLKASRNKLINQGSGSTFKAIGKSNLEELRIPIVDEMTQKKIMNLMDATEQIIRQRQIELQLFDDLIKARFVEMFGDPILNEKEWSCVMITDVCQLILGGGTPSKKCEEFFKGKIPWVTPKDMKQSIINDSIDHITEDAIVHSTTNLIPIWSVLMVIRSGILKHALPVAINSIPVTINQDMKAFIPGENITAEFLMYFFKAIEEDVLSKVRGVTADNIDFKTFQKREIIVPPMELQNQFAAFVTQVDKSKVVA